MIKYGGTYNVYIHTNTINGKRYVGATHKIPAYKRWGATGIGYKKNKRFYADIEHFGWDNFDHEIVASGLNEEEASNMEKILIKELETTNPEKGYNFEKGGLSHAEEERCRKISESTKGVQHHHYGKPVPEETRRKIGDAMRGEKGYWYGKKLPQETLDKMSQKLKGRQATKEFKEMNEKRKRSIRCIETNTRYSSITEAESLTGISHISISRVINGKQNTAGGLHWECI